MLVVLLSSAGNTELPNKFDVVRVDLQPSEQYKSVSPVVHTCMGIEYICSLSMSTDTCTHKMVLAGLRPEVIMEICSRAVSFWTYQVSTRTKSVFVFDWCHIDRGDWYTSISHIVMFPSPGAPGTSVPEVLCYQGSGEGPAAGGVL